VDGQTARAKKAAGPSWSPWTIRSGFCLDAYVFTVTLWGREAIPFTTTVRV
jgi:hypothetical protein